jgi:hypothetical protein
LIRPEEWRRVEMKYWFKECPKCRGDLREESDMYGRYVSCMQCGYTLLHDEEVHLLAMGTLKTEKAAEKARAA